MAICCVSEKIQTAYVCANTLRVLDFFASLHLTIFERPANFEFFGQSASLLQPCPSTLRPVITVILPPFFPQEKPRSRGPAFFSQKERIFAQYMDYRHDFRDFNAPSLKMLPHSAAAGRVGPGADPPRPLQTDKKGPLCNKAWIPAFAGMTQSDAAGRLHALPAFGKFEFRKDDTTQHRSGSGLSWLVASTV